MGRGGEWGGVGGGGPRYDWYRLVYHNRIVEHLTGEGEWEWGD